MNTYTLESLKQINPSYDYQHRIYESDVEKANNWVKAIENSRNTKTPQVGDIVEYTNKHGNFYNAHIERIDGEEGKEINICECPYIPFVGLSDERFYTSTSGGAWSNIPKNLKYIGKRKKVFKDWGHRGACANGTISFEAEVNVWEHTEEPLYKGFSTKTHDQFYVSVLTDKNLRSRHGNYKYLVSTSGCTAKTAFKTDKEYQAWLKTFKGVEFKGYWQNQLIVWTHKQIEKCIPIEEYNNIENAVVDSQLCNATIQECKRIYEDNTIKTFLPYQNNKIPMEHIKVEYIRAYEIL